MASDDCDDFDNYNPHDPDAPWWITDPLMARPRPTVPPPLSGPEKWFDALATTMGVLFLLAGVMAVLVLVDGITLMVWSMTVGAAYAVSRWEA